MTTPFDEDGSGFDDELQYEAWQSMVEAFGDYEGFNPEAVIDRISGMSEYELEFTAQASMDELAEAAADQSDRDHNPWFYH